MIMGCSSLPQPMLRAHNCRDAEVPIKSHFPRRQSCLLESRMDGCGLCRPRRWCVSRFHCRIRTEQSDSRHFPDKSRPLGRRTRARIRRHCAAKPRKDPESKCCIKDTCLRGKCALSRAMTLFRKRCRISNICSTRPGAGQTGRITRGFQVSPACVLGQGDPN